MELLEIKRAPELTDSETQAHLESCARCQVLLANLEHEAPEEVQLPADLPELARVRTEMGEPAHMTAGQLWLASTPDLPHWRFPVLVIGRPRQRPGTVLVAPAFTEIDSATDLDLLLPEDTLGYDAAAAIWAFGPVFEHQLDEHVGKLRADLLDEVRALYQHVAVGGERPVHAHVGLALAGDKDPRRDFRQELLERIRPLYQPVRTAEIGTPAELGTEQEQPETTFGGFLAGLLAAGEEWDKPTLLEQADLSATQLERFLQDDLDLTHARDIHALARTIKALHLELDDVELPLMRSLRRTRGGEMRIGTEELSVAARGESGADEEDLARDLFAGLADVDESPEARKRAAARYWDALASRYEELT